MAKLLVLFSLLFAACFAKDEAAATNEKVAGQLEFALRADAVVFGQQSGLSAAESKLITIRRQLLPGTKFDLAHLFLHFPPGVVVLKNDVVSARNIMLLPGVANYLVRLGNRARYFKLVVQDEIVPLIAAVIARTAQLTDYRIDRLTGDLPPAERYAMLSASNTIDGAIRLALYSNSRRQYNLVPLELLDRLPVGVTVNFHLLNDDGSLSADLVADQALTISKDTVVLARSQSSKATIFPRDLYFRIMPQRSADHNLDGWIADVSWRSDLAASRAKLSYLLGSFKFPYIIDVAAAAAADSSDGLTSHPALTTIFDWLTVENVAAEEWQFAQILPDGLKKNSKIDKLPVGELSGMKIVVTIPGNRSGRRERFFYVHIKKDLVPPTLLLTSSTPAAAGRRKITFTFSEPVKGFNIADDVTVRGGRLINVASRSQLVYSAELERKGSGFCYVAVDSNSSYWDLAGNRGATALLLLQELKSFVATAISHSLAVDDNGFLYSWGANPDGQLGLGPQVVAGQNRPQRIGNRRNWQSVAAGGRAYDDFTGFSIALNNAGELYSWGRNSEGQLGLADYDNRSEPVLLADPPADWKMVATGADYSLAITADGRLYSWGSNTYGQLGRIVTASAPATKPGRVGGKANWLKVAAGGYWKSFSFAINSAGELYSWGDNSYHQLGRVIDGENPYDKPGRVGSSTNWVGVAAGSLHVLARNAAGELYSWGANMSGQLGIGTTANQQFPTAVTKIDGGDWLVFATGYSHSFAINEFGKLYGWGSNEDNQLGVEHDGSKMIFTTPQIIAAADLWVGLSNNNSSTHSFAINVAGSVYGWGSNAAGQLGNASNNDSRLPSPLSGNIKWFK